MAFLARIGTEELKYQIDVVLDKFTMKMKSNIFKVGIVLKRGDHKAENKNKPMLNSNVASFGGEVVVVPTTFYQEKTGIFQRKSAEVQVYIIGKEGTRLAGFFKFDASQLPNNGTKVKKIITSLEKCPDENAKLHFTLRVHPYGEFFGLEVPDDNSVQGQQDDTSSRSERFRALNENQVDINDLRSRSISPFQPVPVLKQQNQKDALSQIKQIVKQGDNQENFNSNSNKAKISKQNNYEEETTNGNQNLNGIQNLSQETNYVKNVRFQQPIQDPESEDYTQQKISKANVALMSTKNNNKQQQNIEDLLNVQNQNASSFISNENDQNSLQDQRSLLKKNKELMISNQQMKQKIDKYEVDFVKLNNQSKSLQEENNQLKIIVQTLQNDKNGAGKYSEDDIQNLKEQYETQIENLENKIVEILRELDNWKFSSQGKQSQADELKRIQFENQKRIDEIINQNSKEQKELEFKVEEQKLQIEHLNELLQKSQDETKKKQNELEKLKQAMNETSQTSQIKQFSELEQQFEINENDHLQQIEELNSKLLQSKRDYQQLKNNFSKLKIEQQNNERKLAEMEIEFDDCKRQNDELKQRVKEAKNQTEMQKQIDDLKKQLIQAQKEAKEALENKFDFNQNNQQYEEEIDDLKKQILQKNIDIQLIKQKLEGAEEEALTAKINLTGIFDSAYNSGNSEFLDWIESQVSFKEK